MLQDGSVIEVVDNVPMLEQFCAGCLARRLVAARSPSLTASLFGAELKRKHVTFGLQARPSLPQND
ncbi:hypothetical protein [Bradyrhizobium sp. 153]|uniref:hypothetical protein n=1 Tax=Bradyrhizobium sp. 153 TaxID=2782627 RepID=UPI001FF7A685|nr:hypothetical protein [Bradyrhizobium sp. 153]MCK1666169.1 hypothetical protein [Bradyrhizobium sp. 153]